MSSSQINIWTYNIFNDEQAISVTEGGNGKPLKIFDKEIISLESCGKHMGSAEVEICHFLFALSSHFFSLWFDFGDERLDTSKDKSNFWESAKIFPPLSVFSKNNSPFSVVCKEYLRCSACSKNIPPPPFFSVYGKIFPYFLFLDEKELCLDRYLMLLLTINWYSQRNVSLWSAIFSFSKRWRLEKRWHQKSRRSENRNRGDPNSIKEFPVLRAVQRAGVAKCEAVTSWKFRAFSF